MGQDQQFNVVRRLLGPQGSHMKYISEESRAKLRIRGRGSNFKEGPQNCEADEPLMVCVSTTTSEDFARATELIESLLEEVYDERRAFCRDRALPIPKLSVDRLKQP